MENVLNNFCGAISWHHAISHVSAKVFLRRRVAI